MIASYQERKSLEAAQGKPRGGELAIVTGVYSDGITLAFEGETAPSSKKYNYNTSISFQVGQRVKVHFTSDTYIVEYPIR